MVCRKARYRRVLLIDLNTRIYRSYCLTINRTEEDVSPSLVMLIAHEYGPVWDLSWCPRGSPTNAAPANGAFPRLGLLAAVFGDGNLRIFAVPHPDSIEQRMFPITNNPPLCVL